MNYNTTIENISMTFDSEFEINQIQKQFNVKITQLKYDEITSSQTGSESYFCNVSGEYENVNNFMKSFDYFGIL